MNALGAARMVLAASLLCACVDLGRPAARRGAPLVRRGREAEAVAERARRARLPRLSPEAREAGFSWVFDAPGRDRGAIQDLYGALRAEARGGALTLAEDVPPDTGFQQASRGRHGWVFLTRRGDVYVSATFTGRLRGLGSLRCGSRATRPEAAEAPDVFMEGGTDRVVLHGYGQLVWSDGLVLYRETDPAVADFAWRDERTGARIVSRRGVEVTDDGGRTWRRAVGVRGDPLTLAASAAGLFVWTTEAEFRVDGDGAAVEVDSSLQAEGPSAGSIAPSLLQPALSGGYEVAPRVTPGACARPPPDATYTLPPFRVAPEGAGDLAARWDAITGRSAPFGRPERIRAARDPAVLTSARGDEAASFASIAWRSADARGPYAGRIAARLPWTLAGEVLTATRDALLADDGEGWFVRASAAGVTRVAPAAGDGHGLIVRARPDGHVGVLGLSARAFLPYGSGRHVPAADVTFALGVAPDGRVTGRATVYQSAVGLGEWSGQWGVVTEVEGGALRFHGTDGVTRDFGRWAVSTARPCARGEPAARLHLQQDDDGRPLPVAFAPHRWAERRVEVVSLARGPRLDDPVCVERVCGVETGMMSTDTGEYGQRTSVCFVTSTERPSLRIDTGERIQTAPAVLLPWDGLDESDGQ